MIFAYLSRLLCLCLASFFLVHLALGLAAWIFAPAAVRLAERMRPRLAVRFLFALRLAPVALALFAVLALCVPSYLWLEPETTGEQVGLACFAMAILGAAVWSISFARVIRALADSVRITRHYQMAGRATFVPGELSPALVIEDEAPLLALAGVIRPQLIISRGVLRALSAEQLDAALRHEDAHRASRDNLKRLLFLLAPEILPFSRSFAALERSWTRLTEWATDDKATGGDPRHAVSLAAALVGVARLGASLRLSFLLSSLVAGDRDLSARVERLLHAGRQQENPTGRMRSVVAVTALLMAGALASVLFVPATLASVHRILEQLLR